MSQQENLLAPSSSSAIASSYFDDQRHCHSSRRMVISPSSYRSHFHTSTISLLDIKEATIEEEDSSCGSSNSIKQHNDQKSADFNIRTIPEQNLEPEHSTNLVAVDNQVVKENASIAGRYCRGQLDMPWSADACKSSTLQVHEFSGSNLKYPFDPNIPLQKRLEALESSRSYCTDSGKQPKSILKQRSVSLLSPSSPSVIDDSLERCVEKIQINIQDEKQQHNENCGNSGHANQPNSNLIDRENRLYKIMQENLRQQKLLRPQTPRHLPQASFNGPFFTLEEVNAAQQSEPLKARQVPVSSYYLTGKQQQQQQQKHATDDLSRKLKFGDRSKSISVAEVNVTEPEKHAEIRESIVHWPAPPIKHEHERARSVPPSLKTRNITDPDRIDEYRRQKELELQAMRRREQEAIAWEEKQIRALEAQERLYYQQMRGRRDRGSPALDGSLTRSHEELRQIDGNGPKRQNELYFQKSLESPLMHIYETRPITATSEVEDEQRQFIGSSNPVTWKRLYIVDQSKPFARNEIITSDQLLERERFDIDLLKRREVFIEKPKPEPVIFRTGKRWKPPPEPSYVCPHMRKALNAEASLESGSSYSIDNATGRTVENVEFRWQPIVHDPEYKQEHKNFTLESSLPGTPQGFGPGPLDESAKRQIKHLIQPQPDGGHRPKPAFGGPRVTPSGGFYPHAPNAIKILKKKHSQCSPEPVGVDLDKEVEIIHQRRFHRPEIADWEKIYDLPAHSSTITSRDTPRNVDVRGKLAAFENSLRQATPPVHLRLNSSNTRRPLYSTCMINMDDGLQPPTNVVEMNRNDYQLQHLRQQCIPSQLSRADSTATDGNHRAYQQQKNERQIIPSNGLLVRQIVDNRNVSQNVRQRQTNRTFCPNSNQQFSRQISPSKLLRPIHEHQECSRHQQHHIRSAHPSTTRRHQSVVQPVVSATQRRLTRIPVNSTVEERLQSRASTATDWQHSSSIND
ncbi:unnamed protein product [Litomosoides sigmodontis]|uniref:Uncharacterized protein n=1 Tax=Litomosoides sigmodontis TaxID=42156 RepID=A0A3P6T5A8_LITSI|nr:unnamed protein product [Litomosoides sigmodontis]